MALETALLLCNLAAIIWHAHMHINRLISSCFISVSDCTVSLLFPDRQVCLVSLRSGVIQYFVYRFACSQGLSITMQSYQHLNYTFTSQNVFDVLIHVLCSLHHMCGHTALHKFHTHLTLLSVYERTIFTAGHISTSTVLNLYSPHPFSATTPLQESLHSCLPLLHRSCTLTLRHSAIFLTF